MTKEEAKYKIAELVEKYQKLTPKDIKGFNEAATKQGFIEPMFRALGWDFENTSEVSPEENASNGRVDYAIKLNGVSQFYIEAKPLKADLNREDYIKQAVSYSYARGVTWAVLTDFESLRVFNALKNTPFISLSCLEYINKFDDIWLLSKSASAGNELSKQAQVYGAMPPFIPIEKRLFKQLSYWRENLFNEIYRYNDDKNLQREQVDSIIQKLFNRLIFMRTCEDRRIEENGLRALLAQWKTAGSKGYLIKPLRQLFREYDGYYDSELFSHHLLDEDIFIDNESLQPVLEGLYEIPGSMASYDFNDIDADVLGAVYEQYLGHVAEVIKRRAKELQAKMELGIDTPSYTVSDKKEHRKEQGIYYTPQFITDYIVKETLGRFLQDNVGNPDKIHNLKIIDPACGSGSFLIHAYDELLKYHSVSLHKPVQQLTPEERLPILTNNIFGVDLDKQAVEIARLNLLLRSVAKREPLPFLGNNIKQGNSLISGTEEELSRYFGNGWREKQPFNWEEEFKDIMKNGGFDIVIGNPPYGAEFDENDRDFIADFYPHSKDNKNSAMVFIEKGLGLLKEGGYFGFIIPKSLAYSQRWANGRKLILEKLGSACDASKAFKEVLLEQMVIVISQKFTARPYYESMLLNDSVDNENVSILKTVAASTDTIPLGISSKALAIFTKMTAANIFMKDISKTSRGLPFQKYITQNSDGASVYRGDHISRYFLHVSTDKLNNNALSKADNKVTFLKQPKILSQRIVAHVLKPTDHIIIMSTYDKEGVLTVDTVENTIITDKVFSYPFILALLNSKLWSWFAYEFIFSKAIRTMDLDDYYIGKLPLPLLKMEEARDKHICDNLVALSEQMQKLNISLRKLTKYETDEKLQLEKEIKDTNEKIDNVVYELYELTEDEKKIIATGV